MEVVIFLINAGLVVIGLTFIVYVIGWIIGLISAFFNSK